MLAKVITLTHKTRSRGFGRVFKYILRADGKLVPAKKRVFESGHFNLTDEPYWCAQEKPVGYAEDLAAIFDSDVRQCRRRGRFAGNPVYHLAITWKEGEHPTVAQAERASHHVMKALGFQDCQALWALHRDTDNDHLHLVINRVHPTKFTAISVPRRDYLILDRSMRELEVELGFSHSNGPYVVVDTPQGPKIVRMSRRERSARGLLKDPNAPRLTPRAQRAEQNLGGASFQRWVTGAPAAALREALDNPKASWEDVHEALARFGCWIVPKGSGIVVTTTLTSGRVLAAKASSLGRYAGKAALERALGSYTPPREAGPQGMNQLGETYEKFIVREHLETLEPAPARDDSTRTARRAERSEARQRLVDRFALEQAQIRAERLRQQAALRERHAKERNALFVRHREERRALRQGVGARRRDQPVVLSLWAFTAASEREALQRRHAEERRALTARLSYGEVWRVWLERQTQAGDKAAESALRGIRYRERRRRGVEDGFYGEPTDAQRPVTVGALRAEIDAARQVVIYRRSDGTEVFRDQGGKLVMRDKEDVSLEAALRVATQKYAGRVEIMGSEVFRERAARMATRLGITVLDTDLQGVVAEERRRGWGQGDYERSGQPSRGEERRPNPMRSPTPER